LCHRFQHLTVSATRLITSEFQLFYLLTLVVSEIYSLSLHDALPISLRYGFVALGDPNTSAIIILSTNPSRVKFDFNFFLKASGRDRKSTRLNSSHVSISYAVCCSK